MYVCTHMCIMPTINNGSTSSLFQLQLQCVSVTSIESSPKCSLPSGYPLALSSSDQRTAAATAPPAYTGNSAAVQSHILPAPIVHMPSQRSTEHAPMLHTAQSFATQNVRNPGAHNAAHAVASIPIPSGVLKNISNSNRDGACNHEYFEPSHHGTGGLTKEGQRFGGGFVRLSELKARSDGRVPLCTSSILSDVKTGASASKVAARTSYATRDDFSSGDALGAPYSSTPTCSGREGGGRAIRGGAPTGFAWASDSLHYTHTRGSSTTTTTKTRRSAGTGRTTIKRQRRSARSDEGFAAAVETPSSTYSDDAANYRWFTVRGRRQLFYNGRTYKGRAAHNMWRQLKRRGQTTAATATTVRSRARTPTRTRARSAAAVSSLPSTRKSGSAKTKPGVDTVPTAPRKTASSSSSGALTSWPIAAPAPLPVKMARPVSRAAMPSKPPVFTPVIDVSDKSDFEDSDDTWYMSDGDGDGGGVNANTHTGRVNESATSSDSGEWDSSSSSSCGGEQGMTDDHDPEIKLGESGSDELPGAVVKRVNNQDVVEYEGWVYPVEVFRAMRGTSTRDQSRNKRTRDIPVAAEQADLFVAAPQLPSVKGQASGGLTVMWGGVRREHAGAALSTSVPVRSDLGATISTSADAAGLAHEQRVGGVLRCAMITSNDGERIVPSMVPTRYTDDANMFDGFDAHEMTGLLDTEDEVGGVRFGG